MVIAKNEIIIFLAGLVVGAGLMYLLREPEVKEIKVPLRVEVQIPVIEKEYDTIYPKAKVIKEVDSSLVEQYKKANDSLKEALFNSAVTVREYEEVFEDSTITITVGANVTGKLNSLVAKYKTKPRVVIVDTTLTVKVPNYNKGITVYGEVGMPTARYEPMPPVLKAGFDITNKNNWIWGGSFDTEKRAWVKLGKKFNF